MASNAFIHSLIDTTRGVRDSFFICMALGTDGNGLFFMFSGTEEKTEKKGKWTCWLASWLGSKELVEAPRCHDG